MGNSLPVHVRRESRFGVLESRADGQVSDSRLVKQARRGRERRSRNRASRQGKLDPSAPDGCLTSGDAELPIPWMGNSADVHLHARDGSR